MENLTLTKAEQSLINLINQHGGITKYRSWYNNNVADRRYRHTYRTNLDKLVEKLKAANALHLLKP